MKQIYGRVQEDGLFWHYILKTNNFIPPRAGITADIRNATRSKYHYAFRFVHKNKELCNANNIAESIMQNRSRDFWSEVKRTNNSGNNRPSVVDGETDPALIGELFSEKYDVLCNSVTHDENEIMCLRGKITELILV